MKRTRAVEEDTARALVEDHSRKNRRPNLGAIGGSSREHIQSPVAKPYVKSWRGTRRSVRATARGGGGVGTRGVGVALGPTGLRHRPAL